MPFNSLEGLNRMQLYYGSEIFSSPSSVQTEVLVSPCAPGICGLSLFLYCPRLELRNRNNNIIRWNNCDNNNVVFLKELP